MELQRVLLTCCVSFILLSWQSVVIVTAFEFTIADRNLVRKISQQSSNELNLFTELGTNTFVSENLIAQVSATRIELNGDMPAVSFRWRASPEVDPEGLQYRLQKYVRWRAESEAETTDVGVQPVFSIPASGYVPRSYEDFSIHLDCSGVQGTQTAVIELFMYSLEPNPRSYLVYVTLLKKCPLLGERVETCDSTARSPKSMCKKLCHVSGPEELARLYCNASAIVVGTFRKTRVNDGKCENRVLLGDWRTKRVSNANSFTQDDSRKKKFQIVVGEMFRTCKCLRRMKRGKRYIFLGQMGGKSRTLHLTGTAFMAKRVGEARDVLNNPNCPN